MFFAVNLLVGVKDGRLMLSLQCHLLLFWRCQEHNQLSGIKNKTKGSEEQRMWFSWQEESPPLMSSGSGLEGLQTPVLFHDWFLQDLAQGETSATNPYLDDSLKPAGLSLLMDSFVLSRSR